MNKKNNQKETQKELKKIIKKMRQIQKNISADKQPVAMHELDTLTELGRRYAKVIQRLEQQQEQVSIV